MLKVISYIILLYSVIYTIQNIKEKNGENVLNNLNDETMNFLHHKKKYKYVIKEMLLTFISNKRINKYIIYRNSYYLE